jgi:hypothetical protein
MILLLSSVLEERNVPRTVKRKANWVDHILCRNCLLKHVTGGKTEGRIEVREDEKEDVRS